ncbi:MAG TPA: hypothetical protein VFG69_20630, partial [Nannocystaceae bacterium]|nr:hypothetical protein [Nannocystaceae bacterium]
MHVRSVLASVIPWLCVGCFDPTENDDGSASGASATDDGHGSDPTGDPGVDDGSGSSPSDTADVTGDATDGGGHGTTGASDPTADPTGGPTDPTDTGDPTDTSDPTDTGDPTVTGDPTTATSDPTDTGEPTDPTDPSTSDGGCVQACGGAVCGDDPMCGESCGSCDFGETCLDAGDYCGREYGFPDDFGFTGDVNGDVLFGHRFTLPAAATLKRFGVVAGGGGTVRMVLYAHNGGPQALVAQSSEMVLVAGSNEEPIADVALAAG